MNPSESRPGAPAAAESPRETRLFRASAALALVLQALLCFGWPDLRGGEDLVPHLRLVERTAESPGIHNVYAPAFHVLGALATPFLGLGRWPGLFAFLGAAGLLAGYRYFQRSAGLPASSAALFCFAPYLLSLSWCIPKIEAAGYAFTLLGLGLLLRNRHVLVSVVLALAFLVHTAAALLLGLAGGILALARGDLRGLVALAGGTLLASPLFLAHLAAGCTLPEAFLFSRDDYLRDVLPWSFAADPAGLLLLAGPIALVLAFLGAVPLWRRSRPVAITCAALLVVYANEVWLVPFGIGTTLDLRRGLTVLAMPVAAAAGMALSVRPRLEIPAVVLSGIFAIAASLFVVQRACYVRVVDVAETRELVVQRCVFRWNGPAYRPGGLPQPPAGVPR